MFHSQNNLNQVMSRHIPWCCAVLSCFSHVRLFAALWTVAHQAPLSMGLSRQEYWSGLPCPPPGDLCYLGIKPVALALQAESLLLRPSGKPTQNRLSSLKIKNSIICQQLYKQKIRWLVNLFLWLFITSLGCGQDGRVGRPLSPPPLTAHQNHYYLQRNSLWECPKDEQKTFHSWRQKEGAATIPTGVAKAQHAPEQQTPAATLNERIPQPQRSSPKSEESEPRIRLPDPQVLHQEDEPPENWLWRSVGPLGNSLHF